MKNKEPISFRPVFMERVWGGRELRRLFGKELPGDNPIGESWEIVDRPEAVSAVEGGRFAGLTLHDLWVRHREQVFGTTLVGAKDSRFPLLIKLLDARDRLSVQVHPPAAIAPSLGGEPKTEVWYFAACDEGAVIYAGLRRGVTRESFEQALRDGAVEGCLHTIPVAAGDSIFIPSGRIHAIGAGNVIIEIQQNSDTTYRVFDWNRPGLDGKPRELHIEESLLCTDFLDIEPAADSLREGTIAECPYFHVEKLPLHGPLTIDDRSFVIIAVASGVVDCGGQHYCAGSLFLLPAEGSCATLEPAAEHTTVLRIHV
ncbi:MAG: class I mannose-6-phosphate isomerase [Terrimicrobiaceae bacterium]